MSAASVISDVVAALVTRFSTISGLKVYDYENREPDTLPALMIGRHVVERTPPDAYEPQLGSTGWTITYDVKLYVALDDPSTAFASARTLTGQAIGAIDAQRGLGLDGVVIDASMTSADMGFTGPEAHRQMVIVECAVEALCLV